MYKIVDKVNGETLVFENNIEQGFALDMYLDNHKEFRYGWVDYKIRYEGRDIIIEEGGNE